MRKLFRTHFKPRSDDHDADANASQTVLSDVQKEASRAAPSRRLMAVNPDHGTPQSTGNIPVSRNGEGSRPEASGVISTEITSTNPKLQVKASRSGSLWDQAYLALGTKNKKLLDNYEKLLSRELASDYVISATGENDISNIADDLDKTENRIDSNTQNRRSQLDEIIKRGLQRVEETKTKYKIHDHEIILEDQIAQTAKLVQWAKGLIDEAVKASPEASIVWAGVSVVLPLLTKPSAAEQANRDGFTYVTARMQFFEALEPLILPRMDTSPSNATLPEGAEREFQLRIVDLYQHIIEFQLQSVLHFYRHRAKNVGRAIIGKDDWKEMLDQIKDLEASIHCDFEKVNDSLVREHLESIDKIANQSFKEVQELMVIARQQLLTQNGILQGVQGIEKLLHVVDAVKLPIIDNARFRSAEIQDQDQCQGNTRVSIQAEILKWANSTNSQPIFWLSGPAGTGKSTIARTIANSLFEGSRLAATYFFNSKINEAGRNDTSRFFTTIASQLIASIPSFNDHLRTSVERMKNVNFEKAAIEEQFEVLIETPLSGAAKQLDDSPSSMSGIIIVDALDECVRRNHISRLVDLLLRLKNIKKIQLKVFVTSRKSPAISKAFESLKDPNAYRNLALENDHVDETKFDISIFLRAQFERIRKESGIAEDPWPAKSDLDHLVKLATTPAPLFVYASTLCRFVYSGENYLDDPTARLLKWLEQCDRNSSQLCQIYEPIMNEVFSGGLRKDDDASRDTETQRQQGMKLLAALVLVADPVSTTVLSSLLSMRKDVIMRYLKSLHAVLIIPGDYHTPITLLHKSFSDFLLDNESAHPFYHINYSETHHFLASRCMEIMEDMLRRDIGNIQDPGKSLDDVEDLASRCIPPELRYSSTYWIHHLLEDDPKNISEDRLLDFLRNHFLHWVEVCCLLGQLYEGIMAIKRLSNWISKWSKPPVCNFIKDAEKWLLTFRPIIERVPLQIYASGVVFCPKQVEIRDSCWSVKLPLIQDVLRTRTYWNPSLWTLDLEKNTEISFSPDSETVAWVSPRNVINIADAATGTLQRRLHANYDQWITSISFSPDGQWVCAGTDRRLIIWDATTGSVEQRLEVGLVYDGDHVIFSHDGKRLAAAGRGGKVIIWNLGESTPAISFYTNNYQDMVIVLSRDGKVAAAGGNGPIHIWSIDSGAKIHELHNRDLVTKPGYGYGFRAMKFLSNDILITVHENNTVLTWDLKNDCTYQRLEMKSTALINKNYGAHISPDGKMIAFCFHNYLVFCDRKTGAERHVFQCQPGSAFELAIAPNSENFATGGRQLRVWDLTANNAEMSKWEDREVTAVAISADSTVIAVGFYDGFVELWETATTKIIQRISRTTLLEGVSSISLSDDHRMIAVVVDNEHVTVYEISTMKLLFTFQADRMKDNIICVRFSRDGKQIAVSKSDRVLIWNLHTTTLNFSIQIPQVLIKDILFDSADTYLIVAYYSYSNQRFDIKTWDATTGTPLDAVNPRWMSSSYFDRQSHDLRAQLEELRLPWTVNEHIIMLEDEWVVRNDQRFLWLPAEDRPWTYGSGIVYRPLVDCSADALIIGHALGQWTFIRFASEGEQS